MSIHTTLGTIVLLTRLAKAIHRRSNEELLGMSFRQAMLLGHLRDREGSMPQQELCEWMWVDPNSCVLLLNELEDLGYVARRREPADRRRHVVELTSEGREALEHADRARDTLEDEILATLTLAERDQLRLLLARALESSG